MYEYNVGMIPEGSTTGDRTRIKIAINEAFVTFLCQQGNRIRCKIIFVILLQILFSEKILQLIIQTSGYTGETISMKKVNEL